MNYTTKFSLDDNIYVINKVKHYNKNYFFYDIVGKYKISSISITDCFNYKNERYTNIKYTGAFINNDNMICNNYVNHCLLEKDMFYTEYEAKRECFKRNTKEIVLEMIKNIQ